MSSLIRDSRRFKDVKKKFPVKNREVKYSNTTKDEGVPIFRELSAMIFPYWLANQITLLHVLLVQVYLSCRSFFLEPVFYLPFCLNPVYERFSPSHS